VLDGEIKQIRIREVREGERWHLLASSQRVEYYEVRPKVRIVWRGFPRFNPIWQVHLGFDYVNGIMVIVRDRKASGQSPIREGLDSSGGTRENRPLGSTHMTRRLQVGGKWMGGYHTGMFILRSSIELLYLLALPRPVEPKTQVFFPTAERGRGVDLTVQFAA